MIWIHHRCNTLSDVRRLNRKDGAEIDLRADSSVPGRIYLAHDPWSPGEDFEAWLRCFRGAEITGPLILNTKEDGLEDRALELLHYYKVTNFFFLDTAFPTLIRCSSATTSRSADSRFAIRVSKYEHVQPALFQTLAAGWVWADCFGAEPLGLETLNSLPSRVRVCLVSPELQQGSLDDLLNFKDLISRVDAICTKQPSAWIRAFPELLAIPDHPAA